MGARKPKDLKRIVKIKVSGSKKTKRLKKDSQNQSLWEQEKPKDLLETK